MRSASLTTQPEQRILLIRLSAIGDIIMASGLIPLLRARYPQGRLVWLVQPEGRALLEANAALDEVIDWPRAEWRRLARRFRWLRLFAEVCRFRRMLREKQFDLVIDLQGLLKSSVWARAAGARERVGLGSKEGSARLMTRVIEKPVDDPRIASEYRHLARVLGLEGAYRMQLALTDADRGFARALIERDGLHSGYAVICPFTTRPQKHWIESYWLFLTQQLAGELGLRVVMLGGPADRVAAARMRAANPAVIDVVGGTSLREAAALIEGATLLIGVDTGLTHMGTAFEVPTITLFGSTCPYRETDSPRTVVMYKALSCSPCRRHPTCGGAFTCMRLITVDEVMAEAYRLLGRT